MRLSTCSLTAVCLANSVLAFYPYKIKFEESTGELPGAANDASSDSSDSTTLGLGNDRVKREADSRVLKANEPSMPHSAALDQDGYDFSYFSTFKVGTPGREMRLVLDTGGPNTWVFGTNCTSEVCSSRDSIGTDTSSSLSVSTNSWTAGYGTGTVSGVSGTDTLSIAGLDVPMTFGLVSKASDTFQDYPIDGIVGLGRQDDSVFGAPTFMEVVGSKSELDSNIVAFYLSRASDGGKYGEVTFGDVDDTRFTGDITYTDVAPDAERWAIPVDDVVVNGAPCNFENKVAIIDTGTSYAILPPEDAKAVNSLIPGSAPTNGGYSVPCDSTVPIQITFSGVSYNISSEDYLTSSGSQCQSTIVGQQTFGKDDWILGDVFLKNVYSVFDFDNDRIGFAQRAVDISDELTTSASPSASATATATDSGSGSGGGRGTGTGTGTGVEVRATTTANPTATHSSKADAQLSAAPGLFWSAGVALISLLWP